MPYHPFATAAALLLSASTPPLAAQTVAVTVQAPPSYARLAGLILQTPVIVDATVRSASQLRGAQAAGVASGQARFYVVADVRALIRGPAAVPPRIATIVDVPLDARGRAPKLGKARVLLFGRPVADRPAELQLAGSDGRLDWTPEIDQRVRGIVREVVSPDAPPEITGIGNAFHVAGSLPGEGETQIFLTTAGGQPVSLNVTRGSDGPPRWAAALGDIVALGAEPPARDTLLWYRLACSLPADLPASALAEAAPGDADQARTDYRFVLESLGPCRRA